MLVDRLILVNKTHDLDRDYVPDDLVVPDVRFKDGIGDVSNQMSEPAARALEAMFDAALADGITLVGMSGYRSYGMQAYIYETRLKEHGLEHVSKYNAKPGQSEHQTGLAMDLSSPDCMVLNTWFDTTDAFKWLSEHCAEYGFIIRYPKGLEEETGYTCDQLTPLLKLQTAAAWCDESTAVYLAKPVEKKGAQQLDEAEEISLESYSPEELKRKIESGEIQDSKTVAGILAYLLEQKED